MKKLKRLLAVVCSLALVAALAVGNMGIVALAVTGGGEDTADYKFSVEVAESVVYGQTFAVKTAEGYTVKVTDPSGKEAAVENGKVTAISSATTSLPIPKTEWSTPSKSTARWKTPTSCMSAKS